jgi:TonB family protein
VPSNNLLEKDTWSEEEIGDRADFISNAGPKLPEDNFRRRLAPALIVSILFNAAFWTFVAQVVHSRIIVPLPPATFKRIVLPPPLKPPKFHHIRPPKPKPVVPKKNIVQPKITRTPPPPRPVEPQYNKVLTSTGPTTATQTAPAGGNAPVGKPLVQNPTPAPPPQPAPQATAPPQPPPSKQPTPAPPPPMPKPTPSPGPTQDALPSNQVYPEIPDELKTDDYKSFVRVKVDISADGTFTVTLVSSSGNDEIDHHVLEALSKWKWKPALNSGTPVESTERFRFNFEVQ